MQAQALVFLQMAMNDLDTLVQAAQSAFDAAPTPAELENAKARFLGKAGQLTELMKGLGELSVEQKKTRGAAINKAKEQVEALLQERREAIIRGAFWKPGWGRRRSTSPFRDEGASRRGPSRHPYPGSAFEAILVSWVRCRRWSRDRNRLVQFHRAQSAAEPFRAVNARHILCRGRSAALHSSYAHQPDAGALHPNARAGSAADQGHRAGSGPIASTPDATDSPMFHQVEGLCVWTRTSASPT